MRFCQLWNLNAKSRCLRKQSLWSSWLQKRGLIRATRREKKNITGRRFLFQFSFQAPSQILLNKVNVTKRRNSRTECSQIFIFIWHCSGKKKTKQNECVQKWLRSQLCPFDTTGIVTFGFEMKSATQCRHNLRPREDSRQLMCRHVGVLHGRRCNRSSASHSKLICRRQALESEFRCRDSFECGRRTVERGRTQTKASPRADELLSRSQWALYRVA